MGFLTWLSEWMGHSIVMLQISMDTGWYHIQLERMPAISQEIHDRLERWILSDNKKDK